MKPVFLSFFLILTSCTKPLNEPKNLISENKMAEIIADFAIADHLSSTETNGNLDIETRYILKKYNIKGEDFKESYKFYIGSPKKMKHILNNAQDIIMNKSPEAEKYIEKKLQENKNIPAFVR